MGCIGCGSTAVTEWPERTEQGYLQSAFKVGAAAVLVASRPWCMDPAAGRNDPRPVWDQAMRPWVGRPSTNMRLSARTTTSTSVARHSSVRERSPSRITCLNRPMVASARAPVLYPHRFCHPMRPCSAMNRRCLSRRGLSRSSSCLAPSWRAAVRSPPPRDDAGRRCRERRPDRTRRHR